jgi:hypothetical protein
MQPLLDERHRGLAERGVPLVRVLEHQRCRPPGPVLG